jgi:MFS family permease
MGLSYSTPSLVVLREAPQHEQGSATAGLQLSDVLGASLGTGIGGALVHLGTPAGARVPGWEALAAIFVVSAVVAVVGFVLTARLGTRIAMGRSPALAEPATA